MLSRADWHEQLEMEQKLPNILSSTVGTGAGVVSPNLPPETVLNQGGRDGSFKTNQNTI